MHDRLSAFRFLLVVAPLVVLGHYRKTGYKTDLFFGVQHRIVGIVS
jgi:hypothetical protein